MSASQNIRLIQARYDAVNAHDLDKFEGFYQDSIIWNDPGLAKPIKGPAAVRRRLQSLVRAFPDLQWHLDRIFSQGENVCAGFTFTGTHKGKLQGKTRDFIPATGESIRLQGVGIYVVKDKKIVDSRIYFDFGALTEQLQSKARQ